MRVVDLSSLTTFTAVNLLLDPGAIPGPVVIPQAAQITIRWNLPDGKVAHNVLYGRYSGQFIGTSTQCNAMLTALSTGAQWTAMAVFLNANASIAGVDIRDVNSAAQPLIQSTGSAVPGTNAGVALPSETAIALTLRTAFAGRGFRGRLFLPGWSSNAVAAGDTVAAACVTAISNWGNTIGAALSAQGYTFSIGQRARAAYTSPITGRVFPARNANTVPIVTTVCRDNHFDSQRRRGLK